MPVSAGERSSSPESPAAPFHRCSCLCSVSPSTNLLPSRDKVMNEHGNDVPIPLRQSGANENGLHSYPVHAGASVSEDLLRSSTAASHPSNSSPTYPTISTAVNPYTSPGSQDGNTSQSFPITKRHRPDHPVETVPGHEQDGAEAASDGEAAGTRTAGVTSAARLNEQSDAETAGQQTASKRRKGYTSWACMGCRRRRIRCDGQPRCSNCTRRDEECIYNRTHDGRKPATKHYVQALENRVRQLESRLHDGDTNAMSISPDVQGSQTSPLLARGDPGSSGPDAPTRPEQVQSSVNASRSNVAALGAGRTETTAVSSAREGDRSEGTLAPTSPALKMTGDAHLAHYGPSSALIHLPEDQSHDTNDDGEESATAQSEPRGRVEEIELQTLGISEQDLPMGVLPSRELHRELLCLFFSYLNDWCRWCDEPLFVAGLKSRAASDFPVRTAHYSNFLHSAILAITLLFTSPRDSARPTMPTDQAMRSAYALVDHAHSVLNSEVSKPLTSTVVSLMLLGTFYFQCTRRQRNMGWLYEGMGARLAQILGLNANCQPLVARGILSQAGKEHRDRTFYTIYIQDILWGFNVGRTASLHPEDFETPLPSINHEQDLEPWQTHSQRLRGYSEAGSGLQNIPRSGWKSTSFHWTCRLIFLGDSIHQNLYRLRPVSIEGKRDIISRLNLELGAWLMDLPAPIRLEAWAPSTAPPYVLTMHAVYNYFSILLNRPIYPQNGGSVVPDEEVRVSVKACDSAAEEIIHIIEMYRESSTLTYATFTLSNIIFTAGTMFLLRCVRSDIIAAPRLLQASQRNVDRCITALQDMSWPASAVSEEILRHMKQETLVPQPKPHRSQGRGSTSEVDLAALLRGGQDLSTAAASALQDPQSALARAITELGWRPPQNATSTAEVATFLGQAPPEMSMPGFEPRLDRVASTPNPFNTSVIDTLGSQENHDAQSFASDLMFGSTPNPHDWNSLITRAQQTGDPFLPTFQMSEDNDMGNGVGLQSGFDLDALTMWPFRTDSSQNSSI